MDRTNIEAQLNRLLAGQTFARASRHQRFLRYVVELSAQGRSEELKEFTIAVEVFDQPQSYDPQIDSVVRSEATRLRNRLEKYYKTEGLSDSIRIEIPKGSYAAVFHEIAPAAEAQSNVPEKRSRRAWIAGAALAAVALTAFAVWLLRPIPPQPAPAVSIAVLPFTDLSPKGDLEYLGDGIAEEVTHYLSRLSGLRVPSRTSAFQYKGRKVDIREIGKRLDVRAAVEGSVRRDGDTVRVTAQLVETATGFHVWSMTWDRAAEDILRMQTEIAAAIARQFNLDLAVHKRSLVGRHSRNADAYHNYLRAIQASHQGDKDALLKAVELYSLATSADPRYGLAWAGQAGAYTTLFDYESGNRAWLDLAAGAVRQALSVNPNLPEAHHANGYLKTYRDWDWPGAERAFRKAVELDPAYLQARSDYARFSLNIMGRHDDARVQLEQAIALEPTNNVFRNELARTWIAARQYGAAREQLATARQLVRRSPATFTLLGIADVAEDRCDLAVPHFRKALEILPGLAWAKGYLAFCQAKLGDPAEASRLAAELETAAAEGQPREVELAAIGVGMGDVQGALGWLERAYARRNPQMIFLRMDVRLKPLHQEPRFREILRQMRLSVQ